LLALTVIVVGILTFFAPIVSTDPPVMQTTQWSPFTIVRQMYLGKLPQPTCERCGEPAVRSLLALPVLVMAVYALMLLALFPLCFSDAQALANIGLIGALLSLGTYTHFATKWEFEETFYGQPQSLAPSSNGPVFYGLLTIAMFAVMGALVFIAAHEELDGGERADDKVKKGYPPYDL